MPYDSLTTVIDRVIEERLSYLSRSRLTSLDECVAPIRVDIPEGVFVEAGCALGGSSIVILSAKSIGRPLLIFDTFEGLPPPTSRDGQKSNNRYKTICSGISGGVGEDVYYGYRDDLLGGFRSNLESYGFPERDHSISIIPGDLRYSMKLTTPVAFAHIDVDWYESVSHCLPTIGPRLLLGGGILVDDYYDWEGCRCAVDEYVGLHANDFEFRRTPDNSYSIKKVAKENL